MNELILQVRIERKEKFPNWKSITKLAVWKSSNEIGNENFPN